jgi:cell division septum initiation protein DivIVA
LSDRDRYIEVVEEIKRLEAERKELERKMKSLTKEESEAIFAGQYKSNFV